MPSFSGRFNREQMATLLSHLPTETTDRYDALEFCHQ